MVEGPSLEYPDSTEEPSVLVPTRVLAEHPLRVQITTYFLCRTEIHSTDLESFEGGIEITPYDRYFGAPDEVCTAIIKTHQHDVEVAFDRPGEYRIRVRGRPHFRAPPEEIVSVEYGVTVE